MEKNAFIVIYYMNTFKKAVVQLSGGLDSTTVLAIAHAQGYNIYCLSFDYGQRNKHELQFAIKNAAAYPSVKEHKIFKIDLTQIGGSALTDKNIAVPTNYNADTIPLTYVPARNTIFNSIALAYAEAVGANAIFSGINNVDYSGYPDCRPEYIKAYEVMANLATKSAIEGEKVKFITPLIALHKEEIIKQGTALGVNYANTISCYNPDENSKACGKCDACVIRHSAFVNAGMEDPTAYVMA